MTNLDLKIAGNRLNLPYPPLKFIEAGNKILVLMDDPTKVHDDWNLNRNIQAFDSDGNFLWTIRHPGFENPESPDNPFVVLRRIEEGVRVADWKGYFYLVDLDTGEVDEKGWRK